GCICRMRWSGTAGMWMFPPDGASEHDYSLRPSDVKRLQNADLVVWIGPEMEAFMDKSTQSIAANKKVTIAELGVAHPAGGLLGLRQLAVHRLLSR
ncbi:metal ABC transporter solute-binding protein, Zn/Mn family, partial [Klebsiella pneumoniae]|uniref:metal ABC transporter solute-binding protein, Zn/Mn family n=1 Tax=Klebsiella pneumoniae TaxID=573 RepID=UPI0035C0823E